MIIITDCGSVIIMETQQTHSLSIMDTTSQLWVETMMKPHLAVLVPHRMAEVGGFTGIFALY